MTRLIFLPLIIFTCQAFCQPGSKVYKFRIYTADGVKKGYLRGIGDSAIMVSPQPRLASKTESIAFINIRAIKIRDRQAPWKGPVIGVIAGTVVGAVIGLASYEEPDCTGTFICFDLGPGFSALGGALVGFYVGGLTGVVAGSISRRVDVYGKNGDYSHVKSELEKYVIQPR